MAETFGIVASAFQVTDAALRLSKAWMGMRDMPEHIRTIVEDSNLLADILDQIQNDPILHAAMHENSTAWTNCFNALQKVNMDFKGIINDLNSHITIHKKSGAVKAYLKRDKLYEYKTRLERLKTNMFLLQQAKQEAIFAQHCSMIMQAVQNQQLSEPNRDQTIMRTTSSTNSNDVDARTEDSLLRILSSSQTHRRHRKIVPWLEVQFPRWFFRKRMYLQVNRSYGLWNINLRVYNSVPDNTDVFQAARGGDWSRVQELFANGKASPFDLENGVISLLHFAANEGNAHAGRFLLDEGHEILPVTNHLHSPLAFLAIRCILQVPDLENIMNLVRILAPSIDYYTLPDDLTHLPFYALPKEAIGYLTTGESSTYNMVEPLCRARTLTMFRGNDPESIPLILGSGLSLRDALKLLKDEARKNGGLCHRDILRRRLGDLAVIIHDESAVQQYIDRWCDVVAEMIAFDRQQHQKLPFLGYLTHFVWNCFNHRQLTYRTYEHGSTWTKKLNQVIHPWIKALKQMGVDLGNLATAEKSLFLETEPEIIDGLSDCLPIRINGLCCGPHVEDWSLYAVPTHGFVHGFAEYEVAGEFWLCVENPELFSIPGAFIDEDYSYVDRMRLDWLGCDRSTYRTSGPTL